MPISRYFSGHGSEVMAGMKDKYGEKKGKQVFYATANKKNQNPSGESENNSSQANGASAVEREQVDGTNGGRRSVTRRIMQNLRNRGNGGGQ